MADISTETLHALLRIVAYPPKNHGPNTFACKVPWVRIERARTLLKADGIDWKKYSDG